MKDQIFISYARKDGFAASQGLRQRLIEAGIPVWPDLIALNMGENGHSQIIAAIEQAAALVMILTPEALKSPTMQQEWVHARRVGTPIFLIAFSDLYQEVDVPRWVQTGDVVILSPDMDGVEEKWVTLLAQLRKPPQPRRVSRHTNGIMAAVEGIYPADGNTYYSLNQASGALLATLEGHTKGVAGARILTDGRILSWSYDATPRLWSEEGETLALLEGHTMGVRSMLVLADGRFLSTSWDDTLYLWAADGKFMASLEGHTGMVYGALEMADGRILSWSADATLRLWSMEGAPLAVLEGHTAIVSGALEMADGRILSWSVDTTLRLWSMEGAPLVVLEGHTNRVMGALEMADGHILSFALNLTLRLWDDTGQPIAINEPVKLIKDGLITPDGRILLWSANSLSLWARDVQLLGILKGYPASVVALVVPDGEKFAGADNEMGMIDYNEPFWTGEGAPLAVLEGHTDVVSGALILADGRILSWSRDHTLRLWSADGRTLAVLEGHTDQVSAALALADGRILSWSHDKTLRLWHVNALS